MLRIFRNQSNLNWKELSSFGQIETQIQHKNIASDSVFAIFKHSTRCSISSVAKRRLEKDWSKFNEAIPIFYLDLIQYRDLSNEVASYFEVHHESPQLILVKNGKAIYNTSHLSISAKEVTNYL